jgi:serine phosphatase RsbU (regulator of sigma subunit)
MTSKKKTITFPINDIHEILKKENPDFANILDDSILHLLENECQVIEYPPNEPIVVQHDPSDAIYIVLVGRCMVMVNDKPVGHMEAGDVLGEMGLIQNTPRSATVMTLEKTQALCIPQATFEEMRKNNLITSWIINLLTDRLKRSSHNTARALKEMEEMVRDHMELGRVQRSLLPRDMPQDPRFRIHVLYSPCAYVGGDYYDAIMMDDFLFMIVADVTGHGAQASISMAIVRSFVHQKSFGKSPQTALKRLNKHLFEYGPDQHFVTSQVAMLDLKKKILHFAYAGHPPLLHVRNGECNPLKGPRAYFLRFKMDTDYKSSSISLKSGDRVAFYTDGVIEMFNSEGDMFNVDGLQDFLAKSKDRPIDSLPTELETTLHRYCQGSPKEDDMTFMVLEIT